MITYDGNNNRYAETDYYYDGGTSLCGSTSGNATTQVANLTGHDETSYGPGSQASRGNVTQRVELNLQNNTTPTTGFSYDESGQLASITDPNGNTTNYSYQDAYNPNFGAPAAQTNTYLTQIARPTTNGVAHVRNFKYRYNDGQLSASTDENSNTTNYTYNDSLLRLTETDYPDGGQTTMAYNDVGTQPTQTINTLLSGSTYETNTVIMDAIGHPIQTQTNSDPQGTVYADTVYDGTGRPFTTSTPYRNQQGESTYGLTTYAYDALGRTTQLTHPDQTATTMAYRGPKALMTDEAGCQRSSQTDGAGRLVLVVEDPGPGTTCNGNGSSHLNYQTTYSYDALDNLLTVNQSGQTRSFSYDSQKRLLSATNPESGIVQFRYDLVGNLIKKINNSGIETCFGFNSGSGCQPFYDALNRPVAKSYQSGADFVQIYYGYDQGFYLACSQNCIGQNTVTEIDYPSSGVLISNNNTSFDARGRITGSSQNVNDVSYPFTYSYNLAGSLASETCPSGRIVTATYDGANRISQLDGFLQGGGSSNYVKNITYAPHGALGSHEYGNLMTRQYAYNSRLQPVEITDVPSSLLTYLGEFQSCSFDMNPYGNINRANAMMDLSIYWGDSATQAQNNNGNLRGQLGLNCLSGTAYNQYESYGYDSVNRLTLIVDNGGGGDSSQTYGYDPYGNMFLANNIGSLPVSLLTPGQGQIDSAHNRLTTTGTEYDFNGNLAATGSPSAVMNYDTEGRMYQTWLGDGEVTTYLYDGDGRRVMKTSGDTTLYVYDAFGQLAAEYSNSDVVPPCETCYISWDHLGTTRLVTDEFGDMVSRHDFLPFGGEIIAGYAGRPSPWGGMDNVNQKFTGKERDQESGLDYFGARYYGSSFGRFTSPDNSDEPQPIPYAILERPQTLNLYGYAENNPLSLVDDDGHSDVIFNGTAGTITVQAQVYDELGGRDSGATFGASNNPQIALSIGKLVDGNYEFLDTTRPHRHSADEDSHNGPYGPGGIFRLKPFTGADQKTHQGVGIHAGRAEMTDLAGRTGCNYATNGCVRTTEPAINFITNLAMWDPLSTLIVTNNRKKPDPKKKDDNGDHPPPNGADPTKRKRLIPRVNGIGEDKGGN